MLNIQSSKILFLGCGKMGLILLENLLKNGAESSQIKIIDPKLKDAPNGVESVSSANNLAQNYVADIIFLCIKPQDSQEILTEFFQAQKFSKHTIFISIIAGKKLQFFKNIFGANVKIVRTMPNLPILENEGVFAYHFSKNFKEEEKEKAISIFKNFGEIVELKNEKKFDDFTAIFGSGPAYIFHLQEIFLEIAKSLEIEEKKSINLVKKLFFGSSMMSQNSSINFSQLRQSVTSKNGTTEAALEVLQKNDALKKLFAKAVLKAAKKSKELSNK